VFNIAAPFPAVFPKDRAALVPEGRDGALRVLAAAIDAGVSRFIHTSSIAAMAHRRDRPNPLPVNEQD
jgi:nucleoside-diphosphate-sugar epimerase